MRNEREKGIILLCTARTDSKRPPKMTQTVTANSVLPSITVKPAELRCGISLHNTAGRILKTLNFKGDTRRIKKGMFMPPLPADNLLRTGNYGIAGPATHNIITFFLHTVVRFRTRTTFFVSPRPDKQEEEIIPRRSGNLSGNAQQ
jgi:hypothetical protein